VTENQWFALAVLILVLLIVIGVPYVAGSRAAKRD
jgi:CHASE1-domain containing sensor protein